MPMLNSLLKHSLLQKSFAKLVLFASLFHISVTCSVYITGYLACLPNLFHGSGIMIHSDSVAYLKTSIQLKDSLDQNGVAAWLGATSQTHAKLYSLSYVAFGCLFGDNILSFEPLNLFYYLSIIILVFKLGEEIFDRQTGLIAGCAVALWPSFLIHTTQLFRDPAFIAATLCLVLIISRWLTRVYGWREGLLSIAVSLLLSIALSYIRDSMWELTLGIIFTGAVMLLLRQLLERRLFVGNSIAAISLISFVCFIPHDFERKAINIEQVEKAMLKQRSDSQSAENAFDNPTASNDKSDDKQIDNRFNAFAKATALRISAIRRYAAFNYAYAASSIDADVNFLSIGDVIRYLPRAMAIGFFAPFPNSWFAANGSMGLTARLLSGIETVFMWAMEALAIYGLWQTRRQLSAWLLLLIAALGVTVLSIVVANLGALYRMRYVFWMLIIILGARGLSTLFLPKNRRLNAETSSA
jgi:hypothetical protein